MEDKLEITGLTVDGTSRALSRGDLLLHPVGLSWGAEIVTDDLELRSHRSGDTLNLVMETAEGEIAGEAKVLRLLEQGDTASLELFGASDLTKGEEVFRTMYV